MLDATDLTLHYGSSQILHGVSVSARVGEVTCIMGSNGVGKTSLLKILSGTHKSSAGSYLLDGIDVTAARPPGSVCRCHGLPARHAGLVHVAGLVPIPRGLRIGRSRGLHRGPALL